MQLVYFLILIFSIIVHEVSHGFAADKLGDPTARYAGRLTLNPLPHIDMLGSIVFPLLSILSPGSFLFGWAKPVPYNPYNFTRARRHGEVIVAAAGPLSNVLLACCFAALLRLSGDQTFATLCFMGVVVNIWLAAINLLPVPPLDGSKILPILLPHAWRHSYLFWKARMEYNPLFGFLITIFFFMLFGSFLSPIVYDVAKFLAGV